MEIKREIFPKIQKHLNKKEITLIVGPRQAGKTTILKALEQELTKENKKTLFFNLDIEEDFQFFVSQKKFLEKVRLEIGKDKGYIFIDEIQRKENAGRFLKGLCDMDLPYKYIVTGSGSLELKEKIHESLAGRKRIFNLGTISFREFFLFKAGSKFANNYPMFVKLYPNKMEDFLKEYLMYGGYPKVVLAQTREEKESTIREIFQSYLVKDLSFILGLQRPEIITRLVEYLAIQQSQLVNYNDISSYLDISFSDLRKYIFYLEETYIINTVRPFYSNKQKEIVKAPVIYFTDIGMRNYAAREFGKELSRDKVGFLFQNLVFLRLKQMYTEPIERIKFWRTKQGNEVDFVIKHANGLIPVEVKYKRFESQKIKIGRGYQAFLTKYKPPLAFLINLNLNKKIEIENKGVLLLKPFDSFLLSNDESLLA